MTPQYIIQNWLLCFASFMAGATFITLVYAGILYYKIIEEVDQEHDTHDSEFEYHTKRN